MLQTKNSKVIYDLTYYSKNKDAINQETKRTFMEKFFVVIFIPLIVGLLLSIIIGFFTQFDYFLIVFLIAYFLVLYISLLEFNSFEKVIKIYPEFLYIYSLSINDEEHKKDKAYVAEVSKINNHLNKTKTVAKSRFFASVLYGLIIIALTFVAFILLEPSSLGFFFLVGGVIILFMLMALINFIGARSDY